MYDIRIKWLTVACFELQFGKTTIVTDPCITKVRTNDLTWEAVEGCDIIAVTHIHWDHVTDISALLEKFPAPVLTGSLSAMPLLKWLNCNASQVYPMDVGTELDFGDVRVKALFGRHTTGGIKYDALLEGFEKNHWIADDPGLKEIQPWGSLEYRNFLFTDRNGTKVLFWGNEPTETQKNMVRELKPDIAILQLSRQDPVAMAEFAAVSGCKIVIPHHMDLLKSREQYLPSVERMKQEFLKLVPDGIFIVPENGRWVEL